MNPLAKYLTYARAPYLTASALPTLVGAAAAWHFARQFDLVNFVLCMLGMMLIHLAVNLWNDYYDFKQGADQVNQNRTQFGGGSGFLLEGASPAEFRTYALGSFVAALACGAGLMIRVDGGIGPVFWLVVIGAIGGWGYTAPPLKFAYRGLGEVDIFLNLGLIPTLGSYYVQTGRFSWEAAVASLPVGFLMTALLWINQTPDAPADRQAGKRTLVVRLGTAKSRYIYFALMAAGFLSVLLPPLLWTFPKLYLLGMAGLIPAVIACSVFWKQHANPPGMLRGQGMTVLSHALAGAFTSLALFVGL